MAPKGRAKAPPCSCGCGRKVPASRTGSGQSWRILILGTYTLFYSTQCLVRSATSNPTWKQDIVSALRPFAKGPGTRGIIAAAIRTLEASPAQGENLYLQWNESVFKRYLQLLLAGICEWHERMGVPEASAWKEVALHQFPGREAFLAQRRCLVWAGLDSTTIYVISHYVRQLSSEQALLAIVIATVCYKSWRYLEAIFGSVGPPWPLTALRMAQLHAQARERNPWIKLAPVGGLTGSGRLSLGQFSQLLNLQQRCGNNTEQYHCFLSFLYCEHVSKNVTQALDDLRRSAQLHDIARRNEETKRVLQQHFLLHGLTLEHVSRLISHLIQSSYDPSIEAFVGERARIGLMKMLAEDSKKEADSDPGKCLRALAHKCKTEFPTFATQILGRDAWHFLEHNMPPASAHKPLDLEHVQLHEHGACEFVKNEDSHKRRPKGLRGEVTPQDCFQTWTRQAYLLP